MTRIHRLPAASLVAAGLVSMALAVPAAAAEALAPHGPPLGHPRMAEPCARINERLAQLDRKLTAEQVRDIVAGRLAMAGEKTLRVGKVAEKDGVVDVEIVTKDGSPVTTRHVSTKTGLPPDTGKRCEQAQERTHELRAEHPGMGRRPHPGMGAGMGPEMGPPPGLAARMQARAGARDPLHLGVAAARDGHDLNLSAAQAKTLAEAALVMAGNPRLKIGAVKEKDADTVTVDIVTQDNSLVARRALDRHTGHIRRTA